MKTHQSPSAPKKEPVRINIPYLEVRKIAAKIIAAAAAGKNR